MPTITLGRTGNQWFKITQSGVSAQHATLTIPDNRDEPWILKDNHSSNGTFIRDANGKMVRISKVEISPMTFIRLGPDDVRGCTFYATTCEPSRRQSPNKYQKEFHYIRKELNQYVAILKKEKEIIKWRRFVNRYSWFFGIFLMYIWDMGIVWATNNYPDCGIIKLLNEWQNDKILLRITVKYIPMFIIAVIAWWVNARGKFASVTKRMDAIRRCPNPKCHNDLEDKDIKNGQCRSCMAQI